jgi:copper chaperone
MKINYLFVFLLVGLIACQGGTKTEKAAPAAEVSFTEISFQVSGMHCDMCVASIEKGVSQLAGIDSVKAVLNDSLTFVRFNASMVSEEEISKAIETRGYKVKGKQTVQ